MILSSWSVHAKFKEYRIVVGSRDIEINLSYSFGSDQEAKHHKNLGDFGHRNDLLNHIHHNLSLHEK